MKKLISAILSVALLMMLLIPIGMITAFADATTLITDQAGLANLSATGDYKLANDITITGEWNNNVMFYGSLDGDGHTITFADGAIIHGGLFKQLREGSNIRNLNIVAGNVTWKDAGELQGIGTKCMGALSASIQAGDGKYNEIGVITSVANRVVIRDVHVTADFTSNTVKANVEGLAIGGIVGDLGLICLIEKCSYTGTIDDVSRSALDMQAYTSGCGGIVGVAVRNCGPIAISECVNNGDISGYGQVGGILGYCRAWDGARTAPMSLIISKCVNNGKITCKQTDMGDDSTIKRAGAGGIAGFVYTKDGASIDFLHNINFGEVNSHAADAAKIEAGICGVLRQKNTVTFSGNINFDDTKMQMIHVGLSNGAVNYSNNYAISGMTSELYTTVADAGGIQAVFNTLNAVYPNVYALDGTTIKLASASSDSGATSDAPQTMTMDVTVPQPTGTAITTQKELEGMKLDGTYYLANDIEVKGTLKAIENFAGVLHGNGHALVLNGAELRGGIFKGLAGGKIYNLSITEASGTTSSNSYRAVLAPNEIDLCFGTVVSYGFGTIVNVTVDCAVGAALKNTSNAYVGGVFGVITDGDSVLYNCYNVGSVQGGYVGGIVGEICCEIGKVEIVRCANWGACRASNGIAGGILATHGLTSAQANMSLLIMENVNYGAVTTAEASYCGGIVGTMLSFWAGKASVLRNANYGEMTANAAEVGCPGGIMGYLGYEGMLFAGNVNVGTVTGTKSPNSLVGVAVNNDSCVVENNYAAQAEIPATIGAIAGSIIDGNTAATLNAAYADAFATGEQITLKWAADAGLSTVAPKVTYTLVDNSEQTNNSGDQGGNTNAETDSTTTETPEEEKKGCKSSVGFGGMMVLLMLCGAGATVTSRRRED